MLLLNQRARALADGVVEDRTELRVAADKVGGARVVDCGAQAPGGLEAGLRLARVSLGGLGRVALEAGPTEPWGGPRVTVQTDHPVAACMASQYAGWELSVEGYFAMGSGPMRAAYGGEALYGSIGFREKPSVAVGVLETRDEPTPEVVSLVAGKCCVATQDLTLLYAPVDSQAGVVQVVARALETSLHKLHELGFDLSRVESGLGWAPLPPVARGVVAGIGRTNDAILYGGHATLWVRGDDDTLRDVGPRVPSSASPDHGRPFREVFAAAGNDFYKIDPMLFSPAVVTFVNLDTGRLQSFGRPEPAVLERSFLS